MKIETSWVSPPLSIGGLDHLGTQAPCVLIYGQLLPGITNVTDRARFRHLSVRDDLPSRRIDFRNRIVDTRCSIFSVSWAIQ